MTQAHANEAITGIENGRISLAMSQSQRARSGVWARVGGQTLLLITKLKRLVKRGRRTDRQIKFYSNYIR